MSEHIDREATRNALYEADAITMKGVEIINSFPVADVVEVETLKAWLYQIAMNNVGQPIEDMASACEEIANRLDGLRAFARERKEDG